MSNSLAAFTINAYKTTKNQGQFITAVGQSVWTPEQMWNIIDQLHDLLGQCSKCGHTNKIDFKDLY